MYRKQVNETAEQDDKALNNSAIHVYKNCSKNSTMIAEVL